MAYKENIVDYKGNIGLLYTKIYFGSCDKCEKDDKGNYQLKFTKLDAHLNTLQNEVFLDASSIPEKLGNLEFNLTTIYPGLLIGSGYSHDVLGDDALKLGFFFDHTTGLPCIPGSSVKGVLRSACEKVNGEYVISIIEELISGERKAELKDKEKKFDKENFKIVKGNSKFIEDIFVGTDLQLSKRDIFFDAFPKESFNNNSEIFSNDYITPHKKPLQNPNPIQFLKVLPKVMFRFDFKLTDNIINKELKLELFRQILLDLGIGAKTNVGYGQFTDRKFTDKKFTDKKIKKTTTTNKNYNNIIEKKNNSEKGETSLLGKVIKTKLTKINNNKCEFEYGMFSLSKNKKEVLKELGINENEINKNDIFTIDFKSINEFKLIKKIN